ARLPGRPQPRPFYVRTEDDDRDRRERGIGLDVFDEPGDVYATRVQIQDDEAWRNGAGRVEEFRSGPDGADARANGSGNSSDPGCEDQVRHERERVHQLLVRLSFVGAGIPSRTD